MTIHASRRKFFGLMAAAPAAGRAMAEELMAKQTNIIANGLSAGYGNPVASTGGWVSEPTQPQWQIALKNPALKQLIESTLFESEKRVGSIDPDIACMRSFSLNAKIAFQRQRNVALRITQMQEDYPWQQMLKKVRAGLGLFA